MRGHRPWWGKGLPPHEEWPGVTIDIPATWSTLRNRWESHNGAYFFDMKEADRACDFFPEELTHHIGEFAGEPFALLPYQIKLLTRPIFGWKRTDDGLRRFRKLFAFIPKGSGKSPWAAGTGLYLTCCDNEPAAEVYAIAGDREQARTVHDNAKIMVEESSDLSEICEVLKNSIFCYINRAVYKVIAAEAKTAHGIRPHGAIFDEFHNQKNRDLFEAIRKSMGKRRQPLLLMITHAGVDDEGTICFEEYEYAKRVLNGANPDEATLPVIFEMRTTEWTERRTTDDGTVIVVTHQPDDWTDPNVWKRVNPGHGITIKHEAIVQECLEAQNEPRKVNDFKRFHGNMWVNQAVAWIPIEWWDRCDAPMPPLAELVKYQCANGTDLAQKFDLAANVTVFRLPLDTKAPDPIDLLKSMSGEPDLSPTEPTAVEVTTKDPETGEPIKRMIDMNYRIVILPTFWLPEDTLDERVKQDQIRYDIWHDERDAYGERLLEVTDGTIIDEDAIVRHVKDKDHKTGLVYRFPLLKQGQFGYDPAFATSMALAWGKMGLPTVEVLQNYTHLNEACQVFEALVKAKRVIHGGHSLLRWNASNVAVKRDEAGRIKPVKPLNIKTKRIDGVVATLIALARLILMPRKKSVNVMYA